MPSITDLENIKKTNKLFKKQEYRPWNENIKNQSKPSSPKTIEVKKKDVVSPKSAKNEMQVLSDMNIVNTEELAKTWRYLYGAKKTLLHIILQNIEEIYDTYVITSPITTHQLATYSSLPVNTIKTSIQQLKQESLILNHETKPGKGGFARYKISKNVYEYFIDKFSSNK